MAGIRSFPFQSHVAQNHISFDAGGPRGPLVHEGKPQEAAALRSAKADATFCRIWRREPLAFGNRAGSRSHRPLASADRCPARWPKSGTETSAHRPGFPEPGRIAPAAHNVRLRSGKRAQAQPCRVLLAGGADSFERGKAPVEPPGRGGESANVRLVKSGPPSAAKGANRMRCRPPDRSRCAARRPLVFPPEAGRRKPAGGGHRMAGLPPNRLQAFAQSG